MNSIVSRARDAIGDSGAHTHATSQLYMLSGTADEAQQLSQATPQPLSPSTPTGACVSVDEAGACDVKCNLFAPDLFIMPPDLFIMLTPSE